MKPTNKQISEHNKLEVLKSIANNGWMTTALCGAWQWPNSTKKVADHKAGQIIKKLLKDGLVFERKTPEMYSAWVLTHAGAEKVNRHFGECDVTEWARHGYNIIPSYYQRHTKIVEYLIRESKKGLAVLGKAQLRGLKFRERLPTRFPVFDAVTVNPQSNYTVGVLIVSNCCVSTQQRIMKCRKHVDEIHLIGDPRTISGLRKFLGQKID